MVSRFEWDPAKALENVRKHGVRFDEAKTVFGDPLAEVVVDPFHAWDESRYWIIGESFIGRLLVVVYTERGDTIRLIGARRATPRERHDHEEDPS
ncbi:MAG: BrnT family toxin [Vicinamibacterales bacterium]